MDDPDPCRRLPAVTIGLGGLALLLAGAGLGALVVWRWSGWRDAGLPSLPPVPASARPRPFASSQARQACERALALPPEQLRLADASNYGERQRRDWRGRRLGDQIRLIVLHESVVDADATVRLFQTPHPRDQDQASYHLLVPRDGQRWRLVSDALRAYGAGWSAFGDFTVRPRATSLGSVNNGALHISLETPADGRTDQASHSGYSEAQYRTLAGQVLLWQRLYGIPMARVTTHAAVDRSHSRYDPRSFRWDHFDRAYAAAEGACR